MLLLTKKIAVPVQLVGVRSSADSDDDHDESKDEPEGYFLELITCGLGSSRHLH